MSAGLIGREAERELFERLLERLHEDEGGTLFLVGEPGIGKTALIAELRSQARARGVTVLSARAAEFESGVPFAVVVDALEPGLASLAPEQLDLGDAERSLIAALFPSLGVAAADGGQRLLRALCSLLEALARAGPLLVALDDLHWADEASLDLVCRLLHRGLDAPVLLVFASRPVQSAPRLLAAIEEAERHRLGHMAELAPLTPDQARELLGDDLEPKLQESLYRESGGNPFYLEQLNAGARRGEFGAPGGDGAGDDVPGAISGLIRSELEALSARARTALYAAAMLGEPFDTTLLPATAELGQADVTGALDELLARDLIRSGDGGARFRFRHPIVQRAVYRAAGAAWALGAHVRVAAALDAQGASPLARAIHVERSASVGDERAIALLSAAGEQALASGPAAAARWFGAAARLIPEEESWAERRLELLARRAAALGTAGDVAETGRTLRAFLRFAPHDGGQLRAAAAELVAMLEMLLGHQRAARELIEGELEALADRQSPEAAALLRVLAFIHVMNADWAAVRRPASQALQARAPGAVRVGALSMLALADFGSGEVLSAQRATLQAVSEYEGLTDADVAALPATASWVAWAEVLAERYGDAVAHLRRASELSRGREQLISSMALLAGEGQALASQGRITELADVAAALLDQALLSRSSVHLSWAMSVKCVMELRRGDLFAAVRFGERGASADAQSVSPLTWNARIGLAEALLEIGEPQRCRAQLLTGGGAPLTPPFPLYEPLYFELLLQAELALGELERAGELAEQAVQAAARLQPLRAPLAQATRARARVLLERSEATRAAEQALLSVRAAEAAGALVETGRSRLLAGSALAAGGQREPAVAELQRAHSELADCGANRYRDEAARELRKLGHVPRVAPGRGLDAGPLPALSSRELQVVERLAAGMTNRQIAEELFLSVRTVDRHTARIYEKLGVSSRAAAASEFERARAAGV